MWWRMKRRMWSAPYMRRTKKSLRDLWRGRGRGRVYMCVCVCGCACVCVHILWQEHVCVWVGGDCAWHGQHPHPPFSALPDWRAYAYIHTQTHTLTHTIACLHVQRSTGLSLTHLNRLPRGTWRSFRSNALPVACMNECE